MADLSPRSHQSRGTISFDLWLAEVNRLLDTSATDEQDTRAAVAVALNTSFGALSRLYQFDELSPAQVVEGIEAAVAFAEAGVDPAVPASVSHVAPDADADEAPDADELPNEDDADEVDPSDDPSSPQREDRDYPEVPDTTPDFTGSQAFGDEGPEDLSRGENPTPEAPFTPTAEDPAEEGVNFAPPRD